MKVVHLSTYDTAGGAGIAAYRLHRALRERAIDSVMVVRHKASTDDSVYALPPGDIAKDKNVALLQALAFQ